MKKDIFNSIYYNNIIKEEAVVAQKLKGLTFDFEDLKLYQILKIKNVIEKNKLIYNTQSGRWDSKKGVKLTKDDIIRNKLPLKFGKVNGDFTCQDMKDVLTHSLVGAPTYVRGTFNICNAYALRSLISDVPIEYVGGNFNCGECEDLTSFRGLPKIIKGDLIASFCPFIEHFDNMPKQLTGSMVSIKFCDRLSRNPNLIKEIQENLPKSFNGQVVFMYGLRRTVQEINSL